MLPFFFLCTLSRCLLCCHLICHNPIANSRDLVTQDVLSHHTMTYCMKCSPMLGCETRQASRLNKEMATTVLMSTTRLCWNAGTDICMGELRLKQGRHSAQQNATFTRALTNGHKRRRCEQAVNPNLSINQSKTSAWESHETAVYQY